MSGETNTINNLPWLSSKNYFGGIPNYSLNYPNLMDSSMFSMPWNNNILGNSLGNFDFNNIFNNNYGFGNTFIPPYYPNFSSGGTTAADDKKAREKDIKKINEDIKAETEKIEKVEKIKENNQQKLEKMTAEKNANDKKFGFWDGVKSFGKGALKQAGNLIGNYDKDGRFHFSWGKTLTTATVVGGAIALAPAIAALAATPAGWVAGAVLLAGGAMSGYQVVKGAVNASNAVTFEDKKHAWEDIGEGSAGVTLSFGPGALPLISKACEAVKAQGVVNFLTKERQVSDFTNIVKPSKGFIPRNTKQGVLPRIGNGMATAYYTETPYNLYKDIDLEAKRKEEQGKEEAFQQKLIKISDDSIKKSNEEIDNDYKKLAKFYNIDIEDYDRTKIKEKIEAAKAEETKKTRNETEG